MACKGCSEEQAAYANAEGLVQTFAVPLPDLTRAELRIYGRPLTPLAHGILKEWLGLVYEQLRPEETTHVG